MRRHGNKFGAKRTTVGDVTFDSKHEARYYGELLLLEKAGLIRHLELQPEFPIEVISPIGEVVRCGRFRADFRFYDVEAGLVRVQDAKSGPTRTEAYRLRKRLVEALHGIQVEEV